MNIVILGYSGLIGLKILKNLAKKKNLRLICVGKNTISKPIINRKVKYLKWDFSSFTRTKLNFLKKANVIINCAGKTNANTKNLKKINVLFIKKLIQYLSDHDLKLRFIHLGSVSVYGGGKKIFGKKTIITENSKIKLNSPYASSKYQGDQLIQSKVNMNKSANFSFTILRVTNVFGVKKKSNHLRYVLSSLRIGFWIKSSNDIIYNFIHVNDICQVINLILSNLEISKNKIYIVSNDSLQKNLYQKIKNLHKKRIFKIHVPLFFLSFLVYFFPLPKKIISLILHVSSQISYSNDKIKRELNFKPKFSLQKYVENHL